MDVGYKEVQSIRPKTKKLEQVDGASEMSLATAVTGLWATGDEDGIGGKNGGLTASPIRIGFIMYDYFHLVLVFGYKAFGVYFDPY